MLRELMADVLSVFAKQNWAWDVVDAPNAATGPPLEAFARRWPQGPYREWWNAIERFDGTVEYVGLDRSIDFVRETLAKRGPYDLVIGYSQGSALATILTALAERGDLAPSDAGWRGVVLFNSGPPPRDSRILPLFRGRPLKTPSVHVLGGPTDVVYVGQKAMVELWSPRSRTVLEHGEGHVTPTAIRSPEVIAQLREAVLRMQASC
jgi:pimeloyl-ACP methyl ester carboxylesterase